MLNPFVDEGLKERDYFTKKIKKKSGLFSSVIAITFDNNCTGVAPSWKPL
jgi:hypothetical protein